MNGKKRKFYKQICFILSFFCFFTITPVWANTEDSQNQVTEMEETEHKTVRVGWYEDSYHITDKNGDRSGYGYEFEQAVSAYTGISDQIKNIIEKEPKSKPKKRAKEVCHLPVICSDSLLEGAFNLCMIHKKDFYRHMEDAHTVSAKVPLQHITVETIQGCRDVKALLSAVTKCIYDVIIKSDIQKKQLSLFDWKKLGIRVPLEF